MAPFKGSRLASCVASRTSEIQGQCQLCRTSHKGPRTPSIITDTKFDFVKELVLDCNRIKIEEVIRPERPSGVSGP